MKIERFHLPVTRTPRAQEASVRQPLLLTLVGGAGVAIALVIAIGSVGRALSPEQLHRAGLCWTVVYFGIPGMIMSVTKHGAARYERGVVSFVRQPGGLVIRTPRILRVAIGVFLAIGLVGVGTSSTIAFCWAISSGAKIGPSGWLVMAVTSLLLLFGIGMVGIVVRTVRRSSGITLTPTHVSAEAEGRRLPMTPWKELDPVVAEYIEPKRHPPGFARVLITTEWDRFAVTAPGIASDPYSVQYIIEFFRQHPEHRHVLVDPRAALNLVKRALAAGRWE